MQNTSVLWRCEERTHGKRAERRRRLRCACDKLPDWPTTQEIISHYKLQQSVVFCGNRACSITHCRCHGPFEARCPVPMGEGGTGPRHMVCYVGALCRRAELWKGRILSIRLINVSVIRVVFLHNQAGDPSPHSTFARLLKWAKKVSCFTCRTDGGLWSWLQMESQGLERGVFEAFYLSLSLSFFRPLFLFLPHCPLWSDRPGIIST